MKSEYLSDYIYFRDNYFNKPKEIFKFMEKNSSINNNDTILDIGCARGEFLHYLRVKKKIKSQMYGVDQSKKLINYALNKSPCVNTKFFDSDFLKFKTKVKFSKIFILGVVECFEDLDKFVRQISVMTKKNAEIYLFCQSNDNNVDVQSKYLNIAEKKDWQVTCLWSKHTLLKKFKKYGLKYKSKKNFSLPFKTKSQKDPMRGFTLDTEMGTFFANGLGQYYKLNLIKFSKQ